MTASPFLRAEARPVYLPDLEPNPPPHRIRQRALEVLADLKIGVADLPDELWHRVWNLRGSWALEDLETGSRLYDASTGREFSLNSAGAFMVSEIRCGRTMAQVAEQLCDAFGMSLEVARADVMAFVNRLREEELLEERSSREEKQAGTASQAEGGRLRVPGAGQAGVG